MGARTYGRYRYLPPEHPATVTLSGARRGAGANGHWALRCEPQVAMRVKRTFGRVSSTRTGDLVFAHTDETARDLEWFIDRYPLAPVDDESKAMLTTSAAAHRATEEAVNDLLTGARVDSLPAGPAVPPRDYQVQAVNLLRTVGGLLLTDQVGLGKTMTALLNCLHDDALPAVVVAPTHLAARNGRWVDELTEHFPMLSFHVVSKGTPYDVRDKRSGAEPDVLILTYTKLAGWVDHLSRWAKYVIFDEVQDLRRGDETAKGVAAGRLADAMKYRLGMTATPVYNYGGEVWNILDVVAPGTLGSRPEFLREWGTPLQGSHVKVRDPAALGAYLREQGVMLGRTRRDVGRELPATQRLVEHVNADPAALDRVAGDAAAMARLILDDTSSREDRWRSAGELDMMMRQATGIAKAPYVAEFVRMLLDSEEKIVLFGWHRAVYDIWLDRLAEFRPVLYTGSESPTQKAAAVKSFTEGAARVLIMSLRSGSGVDGLQKHSRVSVFGELDWSPQVHEQAIGRLERDGMDTSEPAVAYFLVAGEGSDPAIAAVLQVKRQQGEPLVNPDGRLFEHAKGDVNRTRMLAEAALQRAGAR